MANRTMREGSPAVYECIEGFAPAATPDGVQRAWVKGDVVDDHHPILKTHHKFFEPILDRMARNQLVEQATAAPGETRSVRIPDDIPPSPTPTLPKEEPENVQ